MRLLRDRLFVGLAALAASSSLLAAQASTQASAQAPIPPVAAPPRPLARASWYGDRRPFALGDLLSIVVDEQVTATEQSSQAASSKRSQNATLEAKGSPLPTMGPSGFGTRMDQRSKSEGEATRQGRLAAVLSARVIAVEPGGLLRIEGRRSVRLDKRDQVVTLRGLVRPEDVRADNVVLSSRVAEATITYDGKSIAPKRGIIGSLIGIFWP
jgi:flagellar L-ring protein precursor FlgH